MREAMAATRARLSAALASLGNGLPAASRHPSTPPPLTAVHLDMLGFTPLHLALREVAARATRGGELEEGGGGGGGGELALRVDVLYTRCGSSSSSHKRWTVKGARGNSSRSASSRCGEGCG